MGFLKRKKKSSSSSSLSSSTIPSPVQDDEERATVPASWARPSHTKKAASEPSIYLSASSLASPTSASSAKDMPMLSPSSSLSNAVFNRERLGSQSGGGTASASGKKKSSRKKLSTDKLKKGAAASIGAPDEGEVRDPPPTLGLPPSSEPSSAVASCINGSTTFPDASAAAVVAVANADADACLSKSYSNEGSRVEASEEVKHDDAIIDAAAADDDAEKGVAAPPQTAENLYGPTHHADSDAAGGNSLSQGKSPMKTRAKKNSKKKTTSATTTSTTAPAEEERETGDAPAKSEPRNATPTVDAATTWQSGVGFIIGVGGIGGPTNKAEKNKSSSVLIEAIPDERSQNRDDDGGDGDNEGDGIVVAAVADKAVDLGDDDDNGNKSNYGNEGGNNNNKDGNDSDDGNDHNHRHLQQHPQQPPSRRRWHLPSPKQSSSKEKSASSTSSRSKATSKKNKKMKDTTPSIIQPQQEGVKSAIEPTAPSSTPLAVVPAAAVVAAAVAKSTRTKSEQGPTHPLPPLIPPAYKSSQKEFSETTKPTNENNNDDKPSFLLSPSKTTTTMTHPWPRPRPRSRSPSPRSRSQIDDAAEVTNEREVIDDADNHYDDDSDNNDDNDDGSSILLNPSIGLGKEGKEEDTMVRHNLIVAGNGGKRKGLEGVRSFEVVNEGSDAEDSNSDEDDNAAISTKRRFKSNNINHGQDKEEEDDSGIDDDNNRSDDCDGGGSSINGASRDSLSFSESKGKEVKKKKKKLTKMDSIKSMGKSRASASTNTQGTKTSKRRREKEKLAAALAAAAAATEEEEEGVEEDEKKKKRSKEKKLGGEKSRKTKRSENAKAVTPVEVRLRKKKSALLNDDVTDIEAGGSGGGEIISAGRNGGKNDGEDGRLKKSRSEKRASEVLLRSKHKKACNYLRDGNLEDALREFEEILIILISSYGHSHRRVGAALHNIGIAQVRAGRYDEALDAIEEAVRIRRSALGPNHPKVADSLVELGIALLSMEEYEDSLDIFHEALEMREIEAEIAGESSDDDGEEDGDKDDEASESRSGGVDSAEKRKRKAEEEEKAQLAVSKVLNNIGCVHFEAGDIDEALSVYEEALEIQREIVEGTGIDDDNMTVTRHPAALNMASTLCNIGYAKMELGDWKQALALFEEASGIQEAGLERGNKLYINTIENIAFSKLMHNNYIGALKSYATLLEINEACGRGKGIEGAEIRWKMVYAHLNLCEYTKALEHISVVEKIQKRELGRDNPKYLATRELVGWLRYETLKYPSPIEFLSRMVTSRKMSNPCTEQLFCACSSRNINEVDLAGLCEVRMPENSCKMSGHKVSYA